MYRLFVQDALLNDSCEGIMAVDLKLIFPPVKSDIFEMLLGEIAA